MSPESIALRDLARRVRETLDTPRQQTCRALWRDHNSLVRTRPLIYVRAYAYPEIEPLGELKTQTPHLRALERDLIERLYWASLEDDSVIEPYVVVGARHKYPRGYDERWGPRIGHIASPDARGAWQFDPPLKEESDIDRIETPYHAIDEAATQLAYERTCEALGGALPVVVDRGPFYRMWTADLSTDLAHLRGITQMMWDMADRPEWLGALARRMSEGVRKVHDECEAAGDFRLVNHQNQAMPYARELPDPSASDQSVTRAQLWGYAASQEFAQVSPAMFEEFLLRYQAPLLAPYGLVAYGCCEDLTHKIGLLKRYLPNLRRVAASPWANVAQCAAQLGSRYVLSYRPSPADMVSRGFDAERVRRVTRDAFRACAENGCMHVDITLKDVETVQGDATRVKRWVECVRQVIDEGIL